MPKVDIPPTPAEFTAAIKTQYTESMELSTGYLVLNRHGEIMRWSIGASRIFGTTEDDMLEEMSGERVRSIADFFPHGMTKERHAKLVDKEFELLDQAVESDEVYAGGFMAAKDGKVRYVNGKDVDGADISFGIQFCPLFINKMAYLVAFVTKNPQAMQQDAAIVATAEVTQVMKNAKLQLADQVANTTGQKFAGIYVWLENNPYRMLPPAIKPLAAFVTTLTLAAALLAPVGYFVYAKWFVKPPSIHQININTDEDR